MDLVIDAHGAIRCVYGEAIPLAELGDAGHSPRQPCRARQPGPLVGRSCPGRRAHPWSVPGAATPWPPNSTGYARAG